MNAISLFSGVGGLDLGLARAGFRHLAFCESDPYRCAVLATRFPGVPVYDDVRDVGRSVQFVGDGRRVTDAAGSKQHWCERGAVDLLCGGFPCQDLSVAGQRRGLGGDRSGLFFEFARVADAVRPRWLLVENVPGLLSSQGGRDFGTVLGTLADLGYGVAWRVLDSRFFGVPQRRRRVFVVGAVADGDPRAAAERAGQILAVGARCPRHPATRGETREDLAGTLGGGAGERGWAQDTERMTFVAETVRSHPRPGSNSSGNLVAAPLMFGSSRGGPNSLRPGFTGDEHIVAVSLSHGSNPNSNMAGRRREDDENLVVAGPLGGGNDGAGRRSEDDPNLITAFITTESFNSGNNAELAPSLRVENPAGVAHGASVRRLTPVECERLQALPDGWTDLGNTADSKRYAALGDAVTATVGEWIGRRLMAA